MMPQASAQHMRTEQFKDILLQECGFSFENDRQTVLEAALRKRFLSTKVATPEAYMMKLKEEPDEMRLLIEMLTVNETYFFREPDYLRLITEQFVPEILKMRPQGPVRILSAGCSTGEEPYSLAMLLHDIHGSDCEQLLSISGVDIDGSVISGARRAVYGKGSFRGVSSIYKDKYFDPYCEGGWRLKSEVRNLVRFETANLLASDYPALMRGTDIILYRNVSIYFPKHVQIEVFSRLANCLNDGGYMLVGAAETLPHDVGVLNLLEAQSLYVYRKSNKSQSTNTRRVKHYINESCDSPPRSGGTNSHNRSKIRPVSQPLPAVAYSGKPIPPPASQHSKVADNRENLFGDALHLARENKNAEALSLLDGLLALDADVVKVHTLRASILISMQRFRDAKAACERALSVAPLCLDAKLMLGMISFQEEDRDAALVRFREAIYIDASCWLAHFYLAEIMYQIKENKRARGAYETVAKLLEDKRAEDDEQRCFPLSVSVQQFLAICRHKLSLLKPTG